MNKQSIVVVLVLGLLVGFALGFFVGKQGPISELVKVKNPSIPVNGIFSVTGTIKQIQGNVVTIDVVLSPTQKNLPKVLKITVGAGTQIVINQPKDQAVYTAELKAYQKAFVTTTPSFSPQPFVEKILKLSDLKVGYTISAEAAADIKTASSFTATRILIVQTVTSTVIAPGGLSSTTQKALPAVPAN